MKIHHGEEFPKKTSFFGLPLELSAKELVGGGGGKHGCEEVEIHQKVIEASCCIWNYNVENHTWKMFTTT